MGTSRTPKYRIEQKVYYPAIPGKRTMSTIKTEQWSLDKLPKNIFQYLKGIAESFKIGGVNEQAGELIGFIPYPSEAKIIRQSDGKLMKEWKAERFQVWD